jgi:hypothetical protein
MIVSVLNSSSLRAMVSQVVRGGGRDCQVCAENGLPARGGSVCSTVRLNLRRCWILRGCDVSLDEFSDLMGGAVRPGGVWRH